jgi:hypothetical protein
LRCGRHGNGCDGLFLDRPRRGSRYRCQRSFFRSEEDETEQQHPERNPATDGEVKAGSRRRWRGSDRLRILPGARLQITAIFFEDDPAGGAFDRPRLLVATFRTLHIPLL